MGRPGNKASDTYMTVCLADIHTTIGLSLFVSYHQIKSFVVVYVLQSLKCALSFPLPLGATGCTSGASPGTREEAGGGGTAP